MIADDSARDSVAVPRLALRDLTERVCEMLTPAGAEMTRSRGRLLDHLHDTTSALAEVVRVAMLAEEAPHRDELAEALALVHRLARFGPAALGELAQLGELEP